MTNHNQTNVTNTYRKFILTHTGEICYCLNPSNTKLGIKITI